MDFQNLLNVFKTNHRKTSKFLLPVILCLICAIEAPVFAESPAESVMEDIMEEIRDETQESVKNEAKKETGAVVNAEILNPSNQLSGLYSGLDDIEQFICQLKFSSSKVIARCTSSKVKVRFIGTKSGSKTFSFPVFQIKTTSPSCTSSGSGSGQINGKGDPGTKIGLMFGATGCNSAKTFYIVKQ